jgi:hypothetical protein
LTERGNLLPYRKPIMQTAPALFREIATVACGDFAMTITKKGARGAPYKI